jgi:hypothetical protein
VNGKIYFAGPWFNQNQIRRYEAVLEILTEWRDERPLERGVYVPREFPCPPDADDETRQRVYNRNLVELHDATAVVAITDEKDIGTIFELGYAARIRDDRIGGSSPRPTSSRDRRRSESPKLIGIALDLGERPFNLMLARGLDATCRSLCELRAVLFYGARVSYVGTIE